MVVLIVVGIVLGVVLSGGGSSKTARALPGTIDWSSLSGLQTDPPPWPANGATLSARIPSLGVTALSQEALAFHIHAHLDVYVNGKKVGVPQGVGFGIDTSTGNIQFLTELHTHAADGIIHVESAQRLDYTLDQFFGEWGVKLTKTCVGRYCGKVSWWVDGKRRFGNPGKLVLREHEEIAIAFGKPPAKIPTGFDFKAHGV